MFRRQPRELLNTLQKAKNFVMKFLALHSLL